MKLNHAFLRAALLIVALTHASILTLRADHAPRAVLPDAVVDLRTTEGVARVKAQWRYSDTRINEIDHRGVGSDLRASGPKNRTFDFTPDARATDFDDSKWEVIPADSLEKRRGNGRLSLNWYRLDLTIPEKVGKQVIEVHRISKPCLPRVSRVFCCLCAIKSTKRKDRSCE